MVNVSIVNETSPKANWNRRTDRQADRQTGEQDHVLSQADALTKNETIMYLTLISKTLSASTARMLACIFMSVLRY